MQLLLVGISYRTAPVELRERLDFQARGVADALRALALRGSAREAVVVSTCNRKRFQLQFCSDSCWDAHNPDQNHRNPGYTEHTAPKTEA